MDFKDVIKTLGDRVIKLKGHIATEEATKTSFILPFIQALGYDVYNPLEVTPEFTCDIGLKKGEKIDYAILKDEEPTVLIECKHWVEDLNSHDGQLLRYFHVSKAKFGLLTNGIIYRFFSDLEEKNKMDEKPFLEFNITEIRDNQIEELKKFHKAYFDIDNIITTAGELKYTNELKQCIGQEFNNPSPDFVRYFAKQVYSGLITAKILEQFTALTKKSIQFYISDLITERLKTALSKEDEIKKDSEEIVTEQDSKNLIETTNEEIEAYMIIKSILRKAIDPHRIFYRDAQSYCAIILDNNRNKTLCRLYFTNKKLAIGIFDSNKSETKTTLNNLDDIYNLSENLINVVNFYNCKS